MLEKNIDGLAWQETMRLLNLACLEMLSDGPCREQLLDEAIAFEESTDASPGENRDLIVKLVTKLISEASPYKPRHVVVWQGNAGESDQREPNLEGIFHPVFP